jgi:two-component system chemotaxis sensor kinase CheA
MTDRSQKLADFLSEAQETIDALGRELMRLSREGEADADGVNAVFRAAHTLKGLAAIAGVERMTRLAHALEDALDDARMGRRALDAATLDVLLEAPEVFASIIAEEARGAVPRTADAAARLADRLRAGAVRTAAKPASDPLDALLLAPPVRAVLTEYEEHRLRTAVEKGLALYRVSVVLPLETFDAELALLGGRLKRVGELVSTLPSPDARDPGTIAFELLFATPEPRDAVERAAGAGAAVEPVERLAGGAAGPAGAPAPEAPDPAGAARGAALSPAPEGRAEAASLRSVSQAVRVDIRKLDRLMNAVGELGLVKGSLLAMAERLAAEGGRSALVSELQRLNRALERRVDELQAGILEVRLVPLEGVFDKLARMVRKLSRELGKEVSLEVTGGDVQLDKLIVEDLSDPLMHLIRNAIDHAIEPPEDRVRAGKPRAGRIRLAAAQKGNHVRITVEDDGSGIDVARVREVAVARGVASREAVLELSEREALNLVFLPGFSTAREVTALSGRGVGLDVVKSNVANLSGVIDLATTRGAGTRFEITLPVTLAIVRALVVEVASRVYALPLNGVLEIVEVRAPEVKRLSRREVITLRGATLPLVRLGELFLLAEARRPERFFVVVVGLAQERLGIAVDALLGRQDIVVKPLGARLASVRGIAGATDLGDRRTVLVLDVGAIVEDVVAGEGREAAG